MKCNDYTLLTKINRLQEIQMNNSPDSEVWQEASRILAPLFAEMAKRQKAKAKKERECQQ